MIVKVDFCYPWQDCKYGGISSKLCAIIKMHIIEKFKFKFEDKYFLRSIENMFNFRNNAIE